MRRADLTFRIKGQMQVPADLQRERVVISCVTEEGKSLDLEADYRVCRFDPGVRHLLHEADAAV
jgi:hypothetical protein